MHGRITGGALMLFAAYSIFFGYVSCALNKDTLNTGISLPMFLFFPAIFLIGSSSLLIASFRSRTSEGVAKVWRLFGAPVAILSSGSIIFPIWIYRQGYMIVYEDWIAQGMPEKPTDSNMGMMIFCFLTVIASIIPLACAAIRQIKQA